MCHETPCTSPTHRVGHASCAAVIDLTLFAACAAPSLVDYDFFLSTAHVPCMLHALVCFWRHAASLGCCFHTSAKNFHCAYVPKRDVTAPQGLRSRASGACIGSSSVTPAHPQLASKRSASFNVSSPVDIMHASRACAWAPSVDGSLRA